MWDGRLSFNGQEVVERGRDNSINPEVNRMIVLNPRICFLLLVPMFF